MRPATVLCATLLPVHAFAFGTHDAYLLTMAPGRHIFSRFGHNAILLRDRATGGTEVYNFGSFIANDPDLVSKYLARKLKYFVSVSTLESTLASYRGRTLWAQHLDLPAASIDRLVALLRWQALPENREYLYDHFRDNCSTRVRDVLDEVTHGALRAAFVDVPAGTTIRREMEAMLGPVPFWRLGISFVLSGVIDRPATRWETQFLPRQLRDALRDVRLQHPDGSVRPLVAAERTLLTGLEEPTETTRWPLVLVALAMLVPMALGAVAGGEGRAARVAVGLTLALWGLAAFAGSVLLLYLWSTELPAASANGNLLYTTPLHLGLVPLGVLFAAGRLSRRGRQALSGLLAVLLALAAGDLLAHAAGWAEQSHLSLGLFAAALSSLGLAATRAGAEGRLPPTPARRDRATTR